MEENQAKSIAEVVALVVRKLVDHPEDVKVNEVDTVQLVILEVSVRKGEIGQVIGKGGIIADALRTIITAAAGKIRKRYRLELLD